MSPSFRPSSLKLRHFRMLHCRPCMGGRDRPSMLLREAVWSLVASGCRRPASRTGSRKASPPLDKVSPTFSVRLIAQLCTLRCLLCVVPTEHRQRPFRQRCGTCMPRKWHGSPKALKALFASDLICLRGESCCRLPGTAVACRCWGALPCFGFQKNLGRGTLFAIVLRPQCQCPVRILGGASSCRRSLPQSYCCCSAVATLGTFAHVTRRVTKRLADFVLSELEFTNIRGCSAQRGADCMACSTTVRAEPKVATSKGSEICCGVVLQIGGGVLLRRPDVSPFAGWN